MKTKQPIQTNKSNNKPEEIELQSFKSAYIIPSSYQNIKVPDRILKVGDYYDLFQLNKGDNIVQRVLFLNAYLNTDCSLTIVVVNIKTGELIKCSCSMSKGLPKDWFLMDTGIYTRPDNDEKLINNYYEKN